MAFFYECEKVMTSQSVQVKIWHEHSNEKGFVCLCRLLIYYDGNY